MMALIRLCTCSLLVIALASGAWADEAPGSDSLSTAKAHYAAGLRAYNVGDFDLAITEWKAAYKAHDAPDFLFNIAQAYRGKRDYQQAIFFYNSYLRLRPDAPNLAEVTALRDEMQRLWEDEKKTAGLPPKELIGPDGQKTEMEHPETTASEPSTPVAVPREQESSSAPATDMAPDPNAGRTLKLTGMIAGGAGVVLVGVGVAFAVSASSAESDLEQAARNGEPWSKSLADKEDSADTKATLAKVFIASGAAAVVGGAVAYAMGWMRGKEASTSVSVAPMAGSVAGLSLGWEF